MFKKRRAAMNLTPLLDILIILFFAQALQTRAGLENVTQQYRTTESQLAETQEELRVLPQKIQDVEAKIAEQQRLNQFTAELLRSEKIIRSETESRLDSALKLLEEYRQQEKFQSDIDTTIDVNRVLEMLQAHKKTQTLEQRTERLLSQLATQRTVSETLSQHLDVWIFVVSAKKAGSRWNMDISLFMNGNRNTEFGRHHDGAWAFDDDDDNALFRQLTEELTHNDVVRDLGKDLIVTFWFNEKGLPEHFRLKFRRVYTRLVPELNLFYGRDAREGGRGKTELRMFTASPDSSGLVPEDTESFPLLQGKK